MIHAKREIKDRKLIDEIITNAKVCRIGLCKNNMPYVVPVAFGRDQECVYFHSGMEEGMKFDYIAANSQVCFELEDDVRVVTDDSEACKWDISYHSVIGFGTIEEINDPPRKIHAMNQIMQHYSNRRWIFKDEILAITRVWAVKIQSLTGRRSKDRV
jgi:uncharacterized protein